MPMSYSGVSEKWYVVACTLERSLFKKLDLFLYLSATHDNAFNLLYVSYDEINRRLIRCYHGKFVVRMRKNYLIIRNGLTYDDAAGIVALSNRRKTKCWILSKTMPYDTNALHNVLKSVETQGFDVNTIELFYE